MPVGGGDGDAEMVGVGLSQFWDVGGDLAVLDAGIVRVRVLDEPKQRRLEENDGSGKESSANRHQ